MKETAPLLVLLVLLVLLLVLLIITENQKAFDLGGYRKKQILTPRLNHVHC